MGNELVINTTSHETRIALIENGTIAELYVERSRVKGIIGNIYKGKVVRVLPGMQAAFVDIGLEKAAFLYVADVFDAMEEYEPYMEREPGEEPMPHPLHPIEELLQEGQELLVQISKEPIGTKGARITAHISLPGRHLVYMPTVDHVGISRRIEDEVERERLKEIVDRIKPVGGGFIVRTVSDGKSEEDLVMDLHYLTKLWDEVVKKKDKAGAPTLIHSDLDVTQKVLRDILTESVERIVVDSKPEHDKIVQFITTFMPKMKYSIELYDEEEPIFDHFGLEVEISRALGRKVWLKSGGYIIIDFIDMEKEVNREKVYGALEEALKSDKSKTNILKISELGLVEMTRKRVRESLGRMMCEPCPYCEGRGYVKSKISVCHEIFRELRREMLDIRGTKVMLTVHPQVADLLYDGERRGLEELEKNFKKRITVRAKPGFHQEQFEVAVS